MKLYELINLLCIDQPVIIYINENDCYKQIYLGLLCSAYDSIDVWLKVSRLLTCVMDGCAYLMIVLNGKCNG